MARFDVGRTQLVDHVRALGAVAGLEDPGRVIETLIDAGADATASAARIGSEHGADLVSVDEALRFLG